MCKWGTEKKVITFQQWQEGHINQDSVLDEYLKSLPALTRVDSCLAELVEILNQYRIQTIAACCGHGKTPYSGIRIHPKNVLLLPMGQELTVHLKFPYPGNR